MVSDFMRWGRGINWNVAKVGKKWEITGRLGNGFPLFKTKTAAYEAASTLSWPKLLARSPALGSRAWRTFMSMNWHQRRHGWTCTECGTFNEEGSYNCDSEECEMDRRRDVRDYVRRGLIHRFRQEHRTRSS